MAQFISRITVLVRDQDEALRFYTEKMNFELLEDYMVGPDKRWVMVAPRGSNGCAVVLALAKSDEQYSRVGYQTGGKVLAVLHTDTFENDVNALLGHGIRIVRGPLEEDWGKVVVFEDLYGNLWDLVGSG